MLKCACVLVFTAHERMRPAALRIIASLLQRFYSGRVHEMRLLLQIKRGHAQDYQRMHLVPGTCVDDEA